MPKRRHKTTKSSSVIGRSFQPICSFYILSARSRIGKNGVPSVQHHIMDAANCPRSTLVLKDALEQLLCVADGCRFVIGRVRLPAAKESQSEVVRRLAALVTEPLIQHSLRLVKFDDRSVN